MHEYAFDVSRFRRNMADMSMLMHLITNPAPQLVLSDDNSLRSIIAVLHQPDYVRALQTFYESKVKELAGLIQTECEQDQQACKELKQDILGLAASVPINDTDLYLAMGDLIDFYDEAEGRRHPSFFVDKEKTHRAMADVKLLCCLTELVRNVPAHHLHLPLTQVETLNTNELVTLFDKLERCTDSHIFESLDQSRIWRVHPDLDNAIEQLALAHDHGKPLCL